MSRAQLQAARDLAARIQAANKSDHEFRAVSDRDEDGPGQRIERRRPRGSWHHVGWMEDMREDAGKFFACNEQVAP